MARPKKEDPPAPGAPAWMATFCDMMTLVLCFFVLLFSMSSVDAAKWKKIVSVFNKSNGIFDKMDGNQQNSGIDSPDSTEDEDSYVQNAELWEIVGASVQKQIQDIIEDKSQAGQDGQDGQSPGDILADLESKIVVVITDSEITIHLPGDILFDTGSDVLRDKSKIVIEAVVTRAVIPYVDALKEVRFEGHTDKRAIHTAKFEDNDGLSAYRAISVKKYVTSICPEIDVSFFSFMGYGESRPINTADTLEAYAQNRRVSIVMVKKVFHDEEGKASSPDTPFEIPEDFLEPDLETK